MSAERTLFQRPFETAFRWLVLTIVLWSFGALAATDQLPPALTLGGFPLILAAWIGEKRFPLSRWLWLVLIVAFLAFDAWIFLDVGRIDAVVYLPIFLLINKLWSPKKARDIVQILVICFFFMVSAAVMTARISFLFLFVVYLFLMLVGLVFLTVRREHEALAALGLDRRSGVDPKEIVPAGFYARAWGAVACTLFLTVWIFALFPRFSTNSLFFPMARGFTREGRMGYGREIQLGNLSSIAPDSTAVLRLQLEDPRRPGERPMNGVYLRGSVVERFNGASWTEAPEAHESRRSEGWKFQFTPRGQAIGGPLREIQQTVFMDPGAEKDLFLL
ncbi:MAG: DUF3488 domain-containing protein, partial [Candidatus Sumerlaeota bacterium]|nr:DUF3488 domain-containing protein [Candidatus Sumerlaeota bacterium]